MTVTGGMILHATFWLEFAISALAYVMWRRAHNGSAESAK
jgi:hypothetical protein